MSPQPAPSTGGTTIPVRRKPHRLLWIALAAVLAAAAGVFAWESRTLPIRAVSVQPFVAEGAPEWLAGAITEEIADNLRSVSRPTTDPMFTAILDGSITRSGDRVRVTARLTRGDGHRYWSRTIERPVTEIAREMAAAVLPAARKKSPRHQPPASAYDPYLQARQLFGKNEFAKAVEGFDAAVAADPQFARALAWSSIAREQLAAEGDIRPNDLLPAARDAAERSAVLAPDTAESHLALGIIQLEYDWEWDSARRELDRALELSPGNPIALRWRERWTAAVNGAPVQDVVLPAVPRDPDAARQLLAQADDLRSRAYVSPVQFALAANVAHDADSLFYWLGVAYDERSVLLPYILRNPDLPQADPRLRQLRDRLKLPATP